MSAFIVQGGRRLEGSVQVHGAKNSVLPILAASLLSGGECVIKNCPRLSDVAASVEILRHLGCRVRRGGGHNGSGRLPAHRLGGARRADAGDALLRHLPGRHPGPDGPGQAVRPRRV